MKEYPRDDYRIATFRAENENPKEAAHYRGIFMVQLNLVIDVNFVPDITEAGPPYDFSEIPEDWIVTTSRQARLESILNAFYSVTPHPTRAGEIYTFEYETGKPQKVFLVSPAEFEIYQTNLDQQAEEYAGITGALWPQMRPTPVITFLTQTFARSPALRPNHARLLRASPTTQT